MRLFVGIAVTKEIRAKITEYMHDTGTLISGRESKWVRPESLHVTLKFIGESQKLEEIQRELGVVVSPSISMAVRGVGFFTPQKPRIFWAGVQAGSELERLAADIENRLFHIGIPKEPHAYQQYQPHITLARMGSGRPQGSVRDRNKPTMRAWQNLVANQPPPDFGTMTAEEFILFRSETLPGGSRYTPLKRYPLS